MRIDRDVAIAMDDGIVLRADLFIPIEDGAPPFSATGRTGGPRLSGGLSAAMGLHAREVPRGGQGHQQPAPELGSGRPGAVGAGRVCLRSGRLQGDRPIPGLHGPLVGLETVDLYDCIEWAATQPWSNGRRPGRHLILRDESIPGGRPSASTPRRHLPVGRCIRLVSGIRPARGILCQFAQDWYPRQVENVQHGVGARLFSAVTGGAVSGLDTEDPEVLASRRADLAHDVKSRPVIDAASGSEPGMVTVITPMLSAGNWGGQGLHLRGNIEAFTSPQPATNGWRCMAMPIGSTSTPRPSRLAAAVLRSLPERRGQRLGHPAQGPTSHPTRRRHLHRSIGARVAISADGVGPVPPDRG